MLACARRMLPVPTLVCFCRFVSSENKLNGRSQRLVAYRRNRRVVRIWRPATARQPPVESAAPSTPLASGRHVTARPPSCSRATVGPPAVVPRVPVSASAAETTSRRSPPAKPLTPAAQGSQPGPRALVRRGPLVHRCRFGVDSKYNPLSTNS